VDSEQHHTSINTSLEDVVVLLEREIERLRTSLAYVRRAPHPEQQAWIRWHVTVLDERQDALDEMRTLLLRRQLTAASAPRPPAGSGLLQ
jgi:hypothetical protein